MDHKLENSQISVKTEGDVAYVMWRDEIYEEVWVANGRCKRIQQEQEATVTRAIAGLRARQGERA